MGAQIAVLILVCSTDLSTPDCSIQTATDVIHAADTNSVFECGQWAQALLASTALSPELGKSQYFKVICADHGRVARTDWTADMDRTDMDRTDMDR
jgi:hypothetical protein